MDNASIHHLEEMEDMLTGVGAIIRFVPPYSSIWPQSMYIIYAQIKAFLRANDTVYASCYYVPTCIMVFNAVA